MPPLTLDASKQILALDPAQRTGFAHSCGQRGVWLIGSGNERLSKLRAFILDAAKAWGCQTIAAEYASFGSSHVRGQALANELLGVIKQCAAELGVPVVTYGPSSIKKFICQNGRAPKSQIIGACETWLGFRPENDDVADALAVLLMQQCGYQTNTTRKKKPQRSNKAKQARLFR